MAVSRWMLMILWGFLCFHSLMTGVAFGQNADDGKSGWQATISCDSVPVYSRMSIDSSKVKNLSKGESVTLDLEIIGADGAWGIVREPGKKIRLGYIRSECLEWKHPAFVTAQYVESPDRHHLAPSDAESGTQIE